MNVIRILSTQGIELTYPRMTAGHLKPKATPRLHSLESTCLLFWAMTKSRLIYKTNRCSYNSSLVPICSCVLSPTIHQLTIYILCTTASALSVILEDEEQEEEWIDYASESTLLKEWENSTEPMRSHVRPCNDDTKQ